MPLVLQVEAGERKRRDARHAGVAAEPLQVAEQEIQADSPRDRREREVVSLHAQRDEAECQRHDERQRESHGQREPWRCAIVRRQERGRVRAETDERRLPERRLPRDARQQDEPQRDDAVEADVIAERHPERRRDDRDREQRGDEHQHRETSAVADEAHRCRSAA